jgi:hypothetical protein
MVFVQPVLEVLLMPQGKRRDPRKGHRWRQLLDRWQHSGLSVRAFCQRHRLSEASFYARRRSVGQRPSSDAATAEPLTFVPIVVCDDALLPPAPTLELVLGHGRLIRILQGFDPATLDYLLAALEDPSC